MFYQNMVRFVLPRRKKGPKNVDVRVSVCSPKRLYFSTLHNCLGCYIRSLVEGQNMSPPTTLQGQLIPGGVTSFSRVGDVERSADSVNLYRKDL